MHLAKRLAQTSFPSITCDGVAAFARNDQAHPRMIQIVGASVDNQQPIGSRLPLSKNPVKVAGFKYAQRFWKTIRHLAGP